jgi:purine-nucleoside phosphorylase
MQNDTSSSPSSSALSSSLISSVSSLRETLEAASRLVAEKLGSFQPEVALILGSGLGPLAERIEAPVFIPFAEIPGMGTSTANGHVGRFVAGTLGGKRVIVMQGRLHGYEGYTAQEVAFPVWLMQALGARVLITTNAAGAINESYQVGDFCLMSDHINFTARNPITGIEPNLMAPRFFSMLDAYDPQLRALARTVADEHHIRVQEGVYLGLLGPSFETPAEIRMFRSWGADTVAMSVCEEVIAARHKGMRVLGISLVSNMACGVQGASPSDEEVHEVAHTRERDFCMLITGVLEAL